MAAEPRTTSSAHPTVTDGIVCPFCAHVRGKDAGGACPKCTMEDTAGTRRSTGERIGPWFVLQRKNPTAPGLRFSVLLTLARRGHVTGKSIVRGPTTGQLWRYAAEVKGLSRLFGVCWHCKASVSPDALTCPKCKSAQEIPDDPDVFLENHAAVPMMRDLPETTEELAGFSEAPITGNTPESLPARMPRPNGQNGPNGRSERRIDRKPTGAARDIERAGGGFDNVEDLTRALTLHAPPDAADGRGVRRTNGRVTSEPILSASELATAFQLDAPRSFGRRARSGIWKATKVVVVLGVIVIAAGAATAYFKPEWRHLAQEQAQPYVAQASAWWADLSAKVSGTSANDPSKSVAPLDSDGKPILTAVPPATPIRGENTKPSNAASAPATLPPKPTEIAKSKLEQVKPTPQPTKQATQQPTQQAPAQQPPKPAVETADRTPPKPTPVPPPPSVVDATPNEFTVRSDPTTRPANLPSTPTGNPSNAAATPKPETPRPQPKPSETARAETPKPETPKPESPKPETPKPETPKPVEMSLDEAIAQATELRNSGLDAEARHDWRAAVVIYEQINTLPEAARPSDLKIRLAMARDRLQQGQ